MENGIVDEFIVLPQFIDKVIQKNVYCSIDDTSPWVGLQYIALHMVGNNSNVRCKSIVLLSPCPMLIIKLTITARAEFSYMLEYAAVYLRGPVKRISKKYFKLCKCP